MKVSDLPIQPAAAMTAKLTRGALPLALVGFAAIAICAAVAALGAVTILALVSRDSSGPEQAPPSG